MISLIVFVIIYFYFMFHLYIHTIAVYLLTSSTFLSTCLRFYAYSPLLPSLYILINQPYRSFLLFYFSTGLRFYWSTFFETFLCPSTFGINHTFSFLRVYASTLPTGLRFYWSTFFETFLCPSTFGINHTFSFLRVYASTLPFLFHP